jgi:FkbM family methyltransferase
MAIWESNVRDFIIRYASGICADIGAGIGTHTVTMASLDRVSKVHAFEPVPYNINKLKELKNPKIEIHPFALGKEIGEVELYLDTRYPWVVGHKHFGEKSAAHMEPDKIKVQMKKLSDILNHIDFMKIDVEGMEYDVLLGAGETYNSAWICIERHPWGDYEFEELIAFMQKTHELIGKPLDKNAIHHLFFKPKKVG